jgi:hypothetical protein
VCRWFLPGILCEQAAGRGRANLQDHLHRSRNAKFGFSGAAGHPSLLKSIDGSALRHFSLFAQHHGKYNRWVLAAAGCQGCGLLSHLNCCSCKTVKFMTVHSEAGTRTVNGLYLSIYLSITKFCQHQFLSPIQHNSEWRRAAFMRTPSMQTLLASNNQPMARVIPVASWSHLS